MIDQVDARWPNRDKSSDGTIGDDRHAATKSDHNRDSKGIVRALDISNDPAHGVNARAIAQALLDSRDPRLSYVISNGQMARTYPHAGTTPWQWSKYTGPSDHTHHCHVSAVGDDKLADDTRPWALPGKLVAVPTPAPPPAPAPPSTPGRMTKIYATEFGDATEAQESAYGGIVRGDQPEIALPGRVSAAQRSVRLCLGGKVIMARVNDVGPWNISDTYWIKGARPLAELQFKHKQRAQNKRIPSNPAGIDLTPRCFEMLSVKGTIGTRSVILDWWEFS